MFLPAYTGTIKFDSKISFEGNCFEKIEMEMNQISNDKIEVIVTTSKKRGISCYDFFLLANTEIFHAESFSSEGTHILTFNVPGENAQLDLSSKGLISFLFCESLQDELLSIFTMMKAFIGGLGVNGRIPLFEPKVPEYMEKANLDFLKWSMNMDLKKRPV